MFKGNAGIPWQSQCGFNPSMQNDITGWKSVNILTNAATYAASLVTKNHIYILGGYSPKGALDIIQRASFDANGDLTSAWSDVGTLPDTISEMGYIAAKGRFYLIGGYSFPSGSLSTVYSAPINPDGTLGSFREETPLPNGKENPACFVIKDKLYVVGGCNDGTTDTVYRTTINNDGTLSNWETLPNFPINFEFGKPLLIKDRIYIFGPHKSSTNSGIYYTTYDSNGDIGTWNYVGNMPNNIYRSTMVCTDNYVFSIGGYDLFKDKWTNASFRVPILPDGSIGDWVQISDAPIMTNHTQVAIAGNKIYYIGAYSNNILDNVYSATFTSGIADYTPFYAN
jgi:hypothetical protein